MTKLKLWKLQKQSTYEYLAKICKIDDLQSFDDETRRRTIIENDAQVICTTVNKNGYATGAQQCTTKQHT